MVFQSLEVEWRPRDCVPGAMRLFFLFILAANILYFLYPKENQEPSRDFQRGTPGTAMLVTLAEQGAPPAPNSRVPAEFSGKPAVRIAQAPAFVAEQEPARQESSVETPAESKGVTEIAQQLKKEKPGKPKKGPATGTDKLSCYSLGPFNKKAGAEAIAAQLKKLGASSIDIKKKNEQRNRGYWVYLPSYPSRDAAIAAAERLASNGFTDYFVVSGGERNNSISLGLFTLKQGSERRVERLKQMGFNPKVEARNEDAVVYWLDYRADKKLDWQKNNESDFQYIGLDHLDRDCAAAE